MTDDNPNPTDAENEMPGENFNKSESQLGAETRKLIEKQERLLNRHDKNVAAIHVVIIEVGMKLQAGKDLYPYDNNGFNAYVRHQRLDTGRIYGGSTGQQERTAAMIIARLHETGYAEDNDNAVPEKLDLTGCQRVRPTDILKWARKRQPRLFPKLAKPPGKKKSPPGLLDDDIPDLTGEDDSMTLADCISSAVDHSDEFEGLSGSEKAVLAKQIDILMEEVRKWDTSKLPPKDEIGDPGIGNAPLLDALNVEIAKLTAANAVLRAEPGHAPELVPGDTSLICSFCSKTNTEVARMIKGDKALICDECVALCADIVAEQAKLKAAGSDAETVSGGLSWSGSDATGWTARSSETDLVYTVRRTKARGSKWNVVVYEDGVTLSLSRKPCDSVGLAKEAAEADFAGRGLW